MEDIYIVSGARTAIGDFGGSLKGFKPAELGGKVVTEALSRAGVAPAMSSTSCSARSAIPALATPFFRGSSRSMPAYRTKFRPSR